LILCFVGGLAILSLHPEPVSRILLGSALTGAGLKLVKRCFWNEEALLNGLTLKRVAIDFVHGLVEGLIFGSFDAGITLGIAGQGLSIFSQHLIVGASTGALGNVSVFLLSKMVEHLQSDGEEGFLEKLEVVDVLDLLMVGLFGGLTGLAGAFIANKTHIGLFEKADDILVKDLTKNFARNVTETFTSHVCNVFRDGVLQSIDPKREKEKFSAFISRKMKDFGTDFATGAILPLAGDVFSICKKSIMTSHPHPSSQKLGVEYNHELKVCKTVGQILPISSTLSTSSSEPEFPASEHQLELLPPCQDFGKGTRICFKTKANGAKSNFYR
jgi:hypothetical protein